MDKSLPLLRPVSRYAKKVAERAAGIRPDFDFKPDKKRSEPHASSFSMSAARPAPQLPAAGMPNVPKHFIAELVITRLGQKDGDQNMFFKVTADGRIGAISPVVVNNSLPRHAFQIGDRIRCEVVEGRSATHLRVIRILNILSRNFEA